MTRTKQKEPDSFEDAKREYEEVLETMQDIQAQLGDRNKCDKDGRRLTPDEFWDWHRRAKVKLRHITSRVRYLKQYIKERNPQQYNEKEELKDALSDYATHLDDCGWWDDKPCSCGLDSLLDKYGLVRLEREDVETAGADPKDHRAAN